MVIRFFLISCLLSVCGCALQRSQQAQDAKLQMVGMTKEAVLVCMGPPAGKTAEGATELWTYPSGNGQVDSSAMVSGGQGFGFATGSASRRYCVVNIAFQGGKVSQINYTGATGSAGNSLLTSQIGTDEQDELARTLSMQIETLEADAAAPATPARTQSKGNHLRDWTSLRLKYITASTTAEIPAMIMMASRKFARVNI